MITTWRKSSYTNNQGACVELAALETRQRGIRDSKHPQYGHLSVTRYQLGTLLADIKAGKHAL